MTNVAIIHGTKGSPEGNWFPWLAGELRGRGAKVVVPRMPTPDGQSLTNWLRAFDEQVGSLDSASIVVGHSIGAVFLLRLLERLPEPVGVSVFVAGLTETIGIPEYDELNSSFVEGPYNWAVIRENAGRVLCFSGDNDPYVPLAQGLEIAENLRVEACVVPGGGHLNAETGYTSFSLLLEKLTKLGDLGKITTKSSGCPTSGHR